MKFNAKIWLVIGLLVVIAIIGVSVNKKETIRNVRIGYLPAVHALPLFVAIEKGYFKEANINVEVTKFEAPNQIIDALLSNHIEVSMAGATGITAVAESKRPNSLKIFAVGGGDSAHIADRLIVSKDSRIQKISDLKGKKVGVLPGIQWRTIAQNLFDQNGLDITKDLTLVELAIPLQAQALSTKQVDALLAIEPVLTIVDSLGVGKTLVESPNLEYISNPFYAGVGNASTKFINENPGLFKETLKVLDKATKDVSKDPGSNRKYLVGYTPLTPELAEKVHLVVYKMNTDMTAADIEAVQKFIDVFVKYGVIEKPMDVSTIIYGD